MYYASYAVEVQQAHPGRFAIVKPVDPDDPPVADVIPLWSASAPGRGAERVLLRSSDAVILLEVLVAVLLHQFGDRAVRRAELDDAGIQR